MTATMLIELAVKCVVVSGVTLLLLEALKGRSAAERSWVGHAGLVVLLLLPLGALILPNWRLGGITSQVSAPILAPGSGAALPASSTAVPALPPSIDLELLLQGLYALGVAVLLLLMALSVIRLFALQRRSIVLVDADWLTALARAQRRMGVKYGAALLVTDELNSPVSWGMLRPTILLNEKVVPLHADAEAIIAHELAHVVRLDWAKLLVARAVTALFWFNPLVWILARQCHQLREEAADDAVLRSDVPSADYAALLVGAARHACKPGLLAAHGVAPSRGSLRQRVTRVLDDNRPRVPAAAAWAAACLAGATLFAGPLSAVTFEPEPVTKRAAVQAQVQALASLERRSAGQPAPVKAVASAPKIATARSAQVASVDRPGPVVQLAPTPAQVTTAPVIAAAPQEPSVAPAPTVVAASKPRPAAVVEDDTPSERDYARAGYPGLIWLQREVLYGSDVTPEYMSELAAAGYPKLTVKQLVSFKTVGITGDYIRRTQRPGERRMTPDELLLSVGD